MNPHELPPIYHKSTLVAAIADEIERWIPDGVRREDVEAAIQRGFAVYAGLATRQPRQSASGSDSSRMR